MHLKPQPRAESIWRPATCQWINGDPAVDATKCGEPVDRPGSAYCAEHARRAGRAGEADEADEAEAA